METQRRPLKEYSVILRSDTGATWIKTEYAACKSEAVQAALDDARRKDSTRRWYCYEVEE